MGVAEIVWRMGRVVRVGAERAGFGLAHAVPPPSGAAGRGWLHAPAAVDSAAVIAAAERILAGHFNVFALRDVELGFPPRWTRDPKTGVEAPLVFGKALDYRQEALVGDIKYLWEPSRHLELVTLAQAWALGGGERFAAGCMRLLDSWFEQNPYPLGPHWTSSLEHGVRLVNWACAWQLLGHDAAPLFRTEAGARFKARWLEAIYRHCHFITGHSSRFSSANNHLLGELMGLLVGSVVWPHWPESTRWRALAREQFEAEALRQTAADGVNREQAFWYHHEVADMMMICGLALRANGDDFGADYWQRLEAMLGFIAAIMDVEGQVPAVGDADDATMTRLDPAPGFSPYRSLLVSGAVLFARADFKRKAGAFDDRNRWLFGSAGEAAWNTLAGGSSAEPADRAFPEGGYWVFGRAAGTPREIRCVVDAGPLGYLSIAAHGHADALAFTLSAGGEELFIDPGTFAYHTQKVWRDYFRGTSAHNTVRVDGVDQSLIGGNFLWLAKARARCEVWASEAGVARFVGSHDGYARLSDPLTHRREFLFDRQAAVLTIRDHLVCAGRHEVELFLHCPDTARVTLEGGIATVERSRVRATVRLAAPGFIGRVARGEVSPPLGWLSRRFDERHASPTLVWRGEITGAATLETRIDLLFLHASPRDPVHAAPGA